MCEQEINLFAKSLRVWEYLLLSQALIILTRLICMFYSKGTQLITGDDPYLNKTILWRENISIREAL